MANVCYANFTPQSTTHPFSVVWKLTRAMKKAGWTYKASGDGTNKDTTGTATNDKWGGNVDPSLDAYPSALDTVNAWWCAEGPGTVRVSIGAAPTGTFIRGERVTQLDGSDGEFQGYVINAAGNSGWAVIKLRSAKTTWTGTGTVTGTTSGATLTPSATPKIYVRQFVFWKNTNTTQGSIYYLCADQSGESAQLFSTLAGSADCSATIAPGAKGVLNSGNNFPPLGIVVKGLNTSVLNGAAGTVTNTSGWFAISSGLGNAQIVAMDATTTTGAAGSSADATFWALQDNNASQGAFSGLGYFIVDDTEQGDQDPYVCFCNWGSATYSQYGVTTTPSVLGTSTVFPSPNGGTSVTWPFTAYVARGTGGTKDVAGGMYGNIDGNGIGVGGQAGILSNSADIARVANHPDGASSPILREPIRVWCDTTGKKIRKGALRWFNVEPMGSSLDTSDTKTWLKITTLLGTTTPAMVVGKYDGVTTPTP